MASNGAGLDVQPVWAQPYWLGQICGWIEELLTSQGTALAEASEPVQERPWSIVIRVPP